MSNVSIEVISPIPGANVGTQRIDVMTVKVRVSAEDGVDLSGITSVMADQVVLSQSVEDPMLWYGRVAVNLGENTLDIQVAGPELSGEQTVTYRNDVAYAVGESILLDEANNRLIVANRREPNIYAVDLNSGTRTLLADNYKGSGGDLRQIWGIAWLEQGSSILVNEYANDILFSLDLASGDRVPVSSGLVGDGENFVHLYQLAVDHANNRVFAADGGYDAIFEIDLSNGDRSIVSQNEWVGEGENFDRIYGIQYHPARNVLFVTDRSASVVFEVDVVTGDRVILSSNTTGSGPLLGYVYDIQLDIEGNRLLATNFDPDESRAPGSILAIDLSSGDRVAISSATAGTSSSFIRPHSLSPLSDSNHVYVSSAFEQRIYKVNTVNGAREVLTQAAVGAGPRLDLTRLELSPDSSIVIAFNKEQAGLVNVDLTTGVRRSIAANDQGVGPDLKAPRDFAVDWSKQIAYVLDSEYKGVVRIELSSGDRNLISDAENVESPFISPLQIVFDNLRNKIYVLDETERASAWVINEIDPITGERKEIFGDVPFRFPRELELPWDGLKMAVHGTDSIFLIDIDTGVSSEVSIDPSFFDSLYTDLHLDEANERLILPRKKSAVTSWDGIIAEVDYNGSLHTLSSSLIGGGRGLHNGGSITYDSRNNRVLVGDSNLSGIVSVSLETGDRIIVSQ